MPDLIDPRDLSTASEHFLTWSSTDPGPLGTKPAYADLALPHYAVHHTSMKNSMLPGSDDDGQQTGLAAGAGVAKQYATTLWNPQDDARLHKPQVSAISNLRRCHPSSTNHLCANILPGRRLTEEKGVKRFRESVSACVCVYLPVVYGQRRTSFFKPGTLLLPLSLYRSLQLSPEQHNMPETVGSAPQPPATCPLPD